MANIYNINHGELIEKAAQKLLAEKLIEPVEWSTFVKTGAYKEIPPVRKDWWYVRAAAVLMTVYRRGPVGTNKLRTKYGGKKNRGHQPGKFFKGSGSIARKILQQLESAGLVKKATEGSHKGRVITPKGKSFLDKIAVEISKAKPKPKKQEVKAEKKEEQ